MNRRIFGVLVLILVLILAACGGAESTTASPPTVEPTTPVDTSSDTVQTIDVGQGFGAAKGFWQVYFNAPTGSSDPSTYTNGIDENLAAAINNAQRTLDIAAFEFNNPVITEAVLNAHERGVVVRMVTDNEHGLEDDDSTIGELIDAGIPVVDDDRSGLMHNKFMIIDGTVVWTGSWNYTINGTYRNNNNAIVLRSQRAVQAYQAEFDEMFTGKEFGKTSTSSTVKFTQDGVPIQILFASEDPVLDTLVEVLGGAQESIRMMAFVFTEDVLGDAVVERIGAGVDFAGIWDSRQATTRFSEMERIACAGGDVRIDGNPFVLHHKVFIIDEQTVVTGSFNFSGNAAETNDENVVIITDPDIAALYLAEFERRWAEA
ncbi:MAG: DUF1669 domain-containing protein, partial [Chloroflexi bacterium]